MSLLKTYRLGCDSSRLAALRGIPLGVSAQLVCRAGCSPTAGSAAKARRLAKKDGWIRHSESFPIIPRTPSAGSSELKFDLCPNCAAALVKPSA
jgi:hypothetical protein